MNDKKSEKPEKPEKPANPEKMQDLLYHLTALYESWVTERMELVKQNVKVEQLINELTVTVRKFERVNIQLRHDLADDLKTVGQQLRLEGAAIVEQALQREAHSAINNIRIFAAESQKGLDAWKERAKRGVIWAALIVIVCAFLISLVTARFAKPEPTFMFTNEQASFLAGGQIIARIYPKLLPKEQKHLQDLINEYAQDLLQARETAETQK